MATVHKWERYSVVNVEKYVDEYQTRTGWTILSGYIAEGYTIDQSNGTYTLTGVSNRLSLTESNFGNYVGKCYVPYTKYNGTSGYTFVLILTSFSNGTAYANQYGLQKISSSERGEYIDNVEASYKSAYPENGAQDGYWYVYAGEEKTGMILATIDGVQRELTELYDTIDAIQRPLDELRATVDGVSRTIFCRALVILPDGTTEPYSGSNVLNYIESNGSQYINTGVDPNQDTRVVWDVELLDESACIGLFGARIAYTSNGFSLFAFEGAKFQDDFGTQHNANVPSYAIEYSIDKNGNQTTLNDSEHSFTAQTFEVGYSMTLFAVNTAGTVAWMGKMRGKTCEVYRGDELLRQFVPYQLLSGEVGLLDLMEYRFYPNAGTGSFTGG